MKKLIMVALVLTAFATPALAEEELKYEELGDFVMNSYAAYPYADRMTNGMARQIERAVDLTSARKSTLTSRLPAYHACVVEFTEGEVYSYTEWRDRLLWNDAFAACSHTIHY